MKSICCFGPAVFFAVVVLNGPSVAGSVEDQCRSAVRAEWKGPGCRQVTVPLDGFTHDPCGMDDKIQMIYIEKVIKCVAQGGPRRALR